VRSSRRHPTGRFLSVLRRRSIIHDSVALGPGTRLGVYEVTAQIDEGGIGQVYASSSAARQRMAAEERRDAFGNRRRTLHVQEMTGALNRAVLDLPQPDAE